MNYKKNYYDYISYVKTLKRKKGDGNYYERHHIIPRSLGGSDEPDNLVLLTAREHYLAHYLLWKFMPCSQTAVAFLLMNKCKNDLQDRHADFLTSRVYEKVRKEVSKHMTEKQLGVPLSEEHRLALKKRICRPKSEETKRKISESNKGKHFRKFTPEQCEKLSKIMKQIPHTKEWNEKVSKALKGKPNGLKGIKRSEETKKKMAESKFGENNPNFGKHWWTDGVHNILSSECPDGFCRGKTK